MLCAAGRGAASFEQFVAAEQSMLRTFGRIMPLLIPLSGILAIALIILSRADTRLVFWLRVGAAFCIAVTVATTLLVNVPINTQTAGWQLTNDPLALNIALIGCGFND